MATLQSLATLTVDLTPFSWGVQLQQSQKREHAMQCHVQTCDMKYAAMYHQLQATYAKWQAIEAEIVQLRQERMYIMGAGPVSTSLSSQASRSSPCHLKL